MGKLHRKRFRDDRLLTNTILVHVADKTPAYISNNIVDHAYYNRWFLYPYQRKVHKAQILDALRKVAAYAKEFEPGTLNYTFLQDADDPLTILAVETFVDQEALDAHTSSEVFKAFFAEIGPLIEAGSLKIHQKTSRTDSITGFGPR